MNNILRYPGGKSRAVDILRKYVPGDCKVVISPFFGGGSFELGLLADGRTVIGNDKFGPLANFWQCLKKDKYALVEEIKKLRPLTKEGFNAAKTKLTDSEVPPTIRAALYFAVNRCSFSGSTCSGGYSKEAANKRFTDKCVDKLLGLQLENFAMYDLDFIDFIRQNNAYDFMYVDPPYYLSSKLYGNRGDLHENFDHDKLFEMLSERKHWLLSYNDCAYVRDKYKDYKIIEAEWAYGMNKTKKSSELLIICE